MVHTRMKRKDAQNMKCTKPELPQNDLPNLNKREQVIGVGNNSKTISRMCSICKSLFATPKDFKEHLKLVGCGGSERFPCHVCKKSFLNRNNLLSHSRVHDVTRKKYGCATCDAEYTLKSSLVGHLKKKSCTRKRQKRHHSVCSICKTSITDYGGFKKHLKLVGCGGSERFPCKVCKESFSQTTHLNTHRKIYHDVTRQRYVCDTCNAEFLNKHSLVNHFMDVTNCQQKRLRDATRMCSVCKTSFTKRADFKRHIERVGCGGSERFPCHICNKTFPFLESLKFHEDHHNGAEKNFFCHTCNAGFTWKRNLIYHLKRKSNCKQGSPNINYRFCSICNLSFRKPADFKGHIETAKCGGNERFPCNICNKAFSLLGSLKSHQKNHNKDMRYVCYTCNASFTTKPSLIKHLKKKLNCYIKRAKHVSRTCSICKISFPKQKDFKEHIKTTGCGGNEVFPCDICNKIFAQSYHLKEHKEIHDGTRQTYFCNTCNADFTSKAALIMHLKKKSNCKHKRSKGLTRICSVCKLSFTKRDDLKQHVKSVGCGGDEQFPCHVCGKTFSKSNNRQTHLKVHSVVREKYFCDLCNSDFTTKRNLENHLKDKAICNGKFSKHLTRICSVCKLSFSKREHLMQHIKRAGCGGSERFPCDVCDKNYPIISSLRKHQAIHGDPRKKYFCKVCNAGFPQISHLNDHRAQCNYKNNLSNSVVKYTCNFCNALFRKRWDLKKHFRTGECGSKSVKVQTQNELRDSSLIPQGKGSFTATPFPSSLSKSRDEVPPIMSTHKKSFSLKVNDNTQQTYLCKFCNTQFTDKSCLTRHQSKCVCRHERSKSVKYTCNFCNSCFDLRSNLKNHFKTEECGNAHTRIAAQSKFPLRESPSVTPENSSFSTTSSPSSLSQSRDEVPPIMSTHNVFYSFEVNDNTRQKYVCELCNAQFTDKSCLTRHQSKCVCRHERSKSVKYTCNFCNSCFGKRSYLKNHFKTEECGNAHTGITAQSEFPLRENSSVTPENSSFSATSSPSSLSQMDEVPPRMSTHNDFYSFEVNDNTRQKYVCELCNAQFTDKSCLTRHQSKCVCRHERSKSVKYTCNFCNSCFGKRSNLKNHFKTEECGNAHTRIAAQSEFALRESPSVTPENSSFSATSSPSSLSQSRDEVPPIMSTYKDSYSFEVNDNTRQKYVCELCNAQFTDKSCLTHHQSECVGSRDCSNSVKYTCNFCNSCFDMRSNLKNHFKTVGCGSAYLRVAAQSEFPLRDNLSVAPPSSSPIQLNEWSMSDHEDTFRVYVFKNTHSIDFPTFVSSIVDDIKKTIRGEMECHSNTEVKATSVSGDVECIETKGKSQEVMETFGKYRSKFISISKTLDIDKTVMDTLEEAMCSYQKGDNSE